MPLRGASVLWTNVAGGNWSVPGNWQPNGLPGQGDDVFITNAGTYTISLDTNSAILNTVLLGAKTGRQTLEIGHDLTAVLTIASNGVMNLNGGNKWQRTTITGGAINWVAGAHLHDMTIGVESTVNVTGSALIGSWVDNSGIFRCADGASLGSPYGATGIAFVNQPGALLELQGNNPFGFGNGSAGSSSLVNLGVFRKSGGNDVVTLSGIAITNTGTIDVQSGTLRFGDGGRLGGVFQTGPGGVIELLGGSFTYLTEPVFAGTGVSRFKGASLTLRNDLLPNLQIIGPGSLILEPTFQGGTITNLTIGADVFLLATGGALYISGTATLYCRNIPPTTIGPGAVLTWTGEGGSGSAGITVQSNGLLNVSGPPVIFGGPLVNYGTVHFGESAVVTFSGDQGGTGRLLNQPGALFEIDPNVTIYGSGSGAIYNAGICRKTSGFANSRIECLVTNAGLFDVPEGAYYFGFAGRFINETGGRLNFGLAGTTNFGHFEGPGSSPSILAGTLAADLRNGYVPTAGATFSIMGACVGTFSGFDLPAVARWAVRNDGTSLRLGALLLTEQSHGAITTTPAGTGYTNGQPVSLTAAPHRYYQFLRWTDGDATDPRLIVAGVGSSYTPIFTNSVPLEQLNTGGGSRIAPVGTPLVLLDGQFYSNNVVPATNGTSLTVQLQSSFTDSTIYYTTNGPDPNGGAIYAGPFSVTAPFSVRAVAYNSDFSVGAEADPVLTLETATAGGGGIGVTTQVDPFSGVSTVTLTATAQPGWTFMSWAGSYGGTNAQFALSMDGPKSVQAVFGTSLTTSGSGTVVRQPLLPLYPYGSTVRLTAIPTNATTYFRFWGGAANGTFLDPLNFTMTNPNPTVSAVFATLPPNTHSLTVRINGSGNVTKAPQSSNYAHNASVGLTATAGLGSAFMGWTGDTNSFSNFLSVVMNTNKDLTANFAAIILPGETRLGSLTASNQIDAYTFSANAGEAVTLRMSQPFNEHNFPPLLQLIAPDGSTVSSASDSVQSGTPVRVGLHADHLAVSGAYQIWCRGYNGSFGNDYSVTLVKHPGSNTNNPDGGVILSGETKTGEITFGDVDVWAFAGDPTMTATLSMRKVDDAASLGPEFLVFAPDGTYAINPVSGNPGAGATFDLQQSGTYLVLCEDYAGPGTNGYTLSLDLHTNAPPIISSFSPELGATGTVVTLYGTNFSTPPANNVVYFGAVQAVVRSGSASSLTVILPAGATYGAITVTSHGLTAFSSRPFLPTFAGTTGMAMAAPVQFAATGALSSVALGDLDGDGKPEIVTTDSYASYVNVFHNIGATGVISNDSFSAPINIPLFAAVAVTLADVDGDGKLDIVVARNLAYGDNVSVLRNASVKGQLSTNSFAAPVSFTGGDEPVAVAVADLDADGRPEIIVVNSLSTNLAIFPNRGIVGTITTQSFASAVKLPLDWTSPGLAISDLDGDGRPDIVTAGQAKVSIYRSIFTNGTITANSFAGRVDLSVPLGSPYGSQTVAIGDLDGDRRPEIVVAEYAHDGNLAVLRNNTFLGAITSNSFRLTNFGAGTYLWGVGIGDLNGDGKPDLAVTAETGPSLAALLNISSSNSPAFTAAGFGTVAIPSCVAVGDLDADGRPDIVVGGLDGTISVFKNTVAFANIHPRVGITNPFDGLSFSAPANLSLGATVSVSAASSLSRIDFYTNTILAGFVTNPPYALNLTNLSLGAYAILAIATDNNDLMGTSAPVSITVTGLLAAPTFSMATNAVQVNEGAGGASFVITLQVIKSANSQGGSVMVQTRDGVAKSGNNGDYFGVTNTLTFAADDSSKPVNITIFNDSLSEGNQDFDVFLSNPVNGSLFNPTNTTVTIIDDDVPPITASVTNYVLPSPSSPVLSLPQHNSALAVSLSPTNGQWRFSWETLWRDSGATAFNLMKGNYEIVFKPLPGMDTPPAATVSVEAGSFQTNAYNYSSSTDMGTGSLRVHLLPESLAANPNATNRAQWRIRGEAVWRDSGVASGMTRGQQIVEFKPITDTNTVWVTPLPVQIEVTSNPIDVLPDSYSTYQIGDAPAEPGVTAIPNQVLNDFASKQDLENLFCGQILSDAGFGSGFVVKERVVLTAAHVVFQDTNESFASVRWFFQREVGTFESAPIYARGAWVLDGYASRRAQQPDHSVSSVDVRNKDVAALFFVEDPQGGLVNLPGRGGYGGFLTSDAATNEWLKSHAKKVLAGYPVEGRADIQAGRLYAVPAADYTFDPEAVSLLEPSRVYSTRQFTSYPGNSGGAVCVEYGGKYFPAAVYLGGFSKATVRSIDSAVVNLINQAEISANGGGNNTGGGVVRVVASVSGTNVHGSAQVLLGPPSALAAGARWKIGVGASNFVEQYRVFNTSTNPLNLAVRNFTVEFADVPGFYTPLTGTINVVSNMNIEIPANYTAWPARLFINPTSLSITGTHGTAYRIEYQNPLNPAGAWSMQHTGVVISNSTTGIVPGTPPTSSGQRFYRALWLDQY